MTKTATVTLESPIARGETTITELVLRKPAAGELRKLSLAQLAQMDTSQLLELLPRITTPTLTRPEVDGMDPADLMSCAFEVADFLFPKRLKEETSPSPTA